MNLHMPKFEDHWQNCSLLRFGENGPEIQIAGTWRDMVHPANDQELWIMSSMLFRYYWDRSILDKANGKKHKAVANAFWKWGWKHRSKVVPKTGHTYRTRASGNVDCISVMPAIEKATMYFRAERKSYDVFLTGRFIGEAPHDNDLVKDLGEVE